MTTRTRKGWNTKLNADRYRGQCLEAFCASLRSISAMNKSIRVDWNIREENQRRRHRYFFLYIFFFLFLPLHHVLSWRGCSCGCGEEAACKMERGMRDNWPIIVDRDDTRVLSQNYSRTVARGWIQFGAASTLTGKKRDETRERREGRTLKGLRRMRDPTEDWSLPPIPPSLPPLFLSLLVFHQIYRILQPCQWIVALRSPGTTYLAYATATAGSIVESQAINSAAWILFCKFRMRNTSGDFWKNILWKWERRVNGHGNYEPAMSVLDLSHFLTAGKKFRQKIRAILYRCDAI